MSFVSFTKIGAESYLQSIDRYLQREVKKLKKHAIVATSGGDAFDVEDVANAVEKETLDKALFAITRLAGIATELKATGFRLFVNDRLDDLVKKADALADEKNVVGRNRVSIHNNVRSTAWAGLSDKVKMAYEEEAKKVQKVQEEKKKGDASELEIHECVCDCFDIANNG